MAAVLDKYVDVSVVTMKHPVIRVASSRSDQEMWEHAVERFSQMKCLFCGEVTGYPVVFWAGDGGDLALHPRCAKRMCRRLLDDVAALADAEVDGGAAYAVKR